MAYLTRSSTRSPTRSLTRTRTRTRIRVQTRRFGMSPIISIYFVYASQCIQGRFEIWKQVLTIF